MVSSLESDVLDGGRRRGGLPVRLTVQAMLTGAFDRTFTQADNSATVSTDTIKNVVYPLP
jgi:urate oxidase